jgi:hypothetical protein
MAKKKKPESVPELPKAALDYFKAQGEKGGKLSGAARMEKMTAKQRSAVAKKAARARWEKAKKES